MTASPFATAAPVLIDLGYAPVTIIPPNTQHAGRSKAPGQFRSGGWSGFPGWSKLVDEPLSGFNLRLALAAPDAGCGIVLGTPAGTSDDGRPLQVVGIDYDVDGDELDILLRATKASPMAKAGRKGLTRMFRAPVEIVSKSYDGPDGRILDLLAKGRQTVVPPSLTIDDGKAYRWVGDGPVAARDLPIFDENDLAQLEEALEMVGWDREASASRARPVSDEPRPKRTPTDYDASDAWARANAEALANVDAWFPALDLPRSERTQHGWKAVPAYRESGTGRAVQVRKQNLSVSSGAAGVPAGISDWGASAGDSKLTAIDLVQRALCLTASEALIWLEDKLGLHDDDGVVIDLKPTAAKGVVQTDALSEHDLPEPLRPKAAPAVQPVVIEPEASPASTDFPAHLLECPGLVGDLAEWMTRTAQRPLPVANLLTALSIVATAGGRRFAGPTESGLVIYGLALAPSGSGKAHPIRAAQHVMRKAGLGNKIAPSSWMSGSALIQHLGRQPACVSYADEVGEFFAKLNGAKSSTHERAISAVLRELFGINWGSYTTPGWAGSNTAASVPPVIHAPAYSFIGYSVPEAVWDAMQGADVTNGMLNRFLLMPTAKAGEEREDPESVFDVPDSIVDGLRSISEAGGALAVATMHGDMASEPLIRIEWDGGKAGDAATLFRELRTYCREHPQGEHLMKRTAEIAVRIATIRAIGRAGARALVTVHDMDWGRRLALFSAERMIADAEDMMSDTEWQQKSLAVLRLIRNAPGGTMTKTQLYRRLNHKYPTRDVKAITDGLRDAGQIREYSARTGERGPASITYSAIEGA